MDSEAFLAFSDDELIEELTRRFPAIVYAMHRESLNAGTGFDGKVGWEGPMAMRLGLADALQTALRLEYQKRILDEEE